MVVRELLVALGFDFDRSKLKQADAGINKFKASAESAIGVLSRMAAVVGLAFGANEVVKMGDAWTNVDSRIGLVTKSAEEQAAMQEKVYDIAQKTRQEYTATGDLFYKLSRSAGQLGASQQDVLDVTATVNEALVVGGASTAESQATILQLSQALASGKLQGDELRSLSENASVLADEIARYYGVTIGELKEMGKDGELTAEGVFKAILKAKSKLDKEFGKMPVTIEQSVTYALNRIGKLIFGINKETSVFQYIAKGIIYNSDRIAGAIERGIKAVGGWKNAIKLAAAALVSLGTAIYIVRNGLFTLQMWGIALSILRIGIINTAKSFITLRGAMMALQTVGVFLILMLIVLALEDIYYWITGGESVLGDYLGTWEEFKTKVNTWISDLVNNLIGYWGNLKSAVFQYIDDMINKAMEWVNKVKNFFGLAGLSMTGAEMGAFAGGYGVTPESMFPGGGGGNVINQNNNIEINQANSNTSAGLANDVGDATGEAVADASGSLTRSLEYVIYP